jgi:4'-phosphopantetheinyl transferase
MTAREKSEHARPDPSASERIASGPAGTEVWLVDLEASSAALEALEAATPRLDATSRLQWESMQDEATRRARRSAHIALRIVLERALGPEIRARPFARNAAGKPSLGDTGGFGFSLAHTAGFALIALGAEPIGVDIENMRPVLMPARRRPSIEAAAIALAAGAPLDEHDDDARLLRAWVRLEAVAKAQGRGLAPLLERLRPDRAPLPPQEGLAGALGNGVVAHDLSVPRGLFAAVALGAGRNPPALAVLPVTRAAIAALLDAGGTTKR